MAFAAFIWWIVPALSQDIRINEILAANNTIAPDNVDFAPMNMPTFTKKYIFFVGDNADILRNSSDFR